MSDLISRSEVLELLYKIFDKYHMSTDKNTSISKSFGTDLFKEIKKMPTAYNVDKVVEEFEKKVADMCFCEYRDAFIDAIEIVKQGGIGTERR